MGKLVQSHVWKKKQQILKQRERVRTELPPCPGESMIPFPTQGKSFPQILPKQAAHYTFSYCPLSQIFDLHEKAKRGKAKIKTKGNKATFSRTKNNPQTLFTMWGLKSKAFSTVSLLSSGRRSSTQSLHRNFHLEACKMLKTGPWGHC